MAAVFKTANFDETESYDWLNASSKIRHVQGSFIDTVGSLEGDVELRFSTIATGTETQIRQAFRDAEYLLKRAMEWKADKTDGNSIWLYVQSEGNETERRALIKDWRRTDTDRAGGDTLLDDATAVFSDWIFTRGPWEASESNTVTHLTSASPNTVGYGCNAYGAYAGASPPGTAGGDGFEVVSVANFLNDGTRNGRIQTMFPSIASPAAGKWYRYWLGMKTSRSDPGTSFQAHECFDDSWGSGVAYHGYVAIDTTDSNALNGNCAEIQWGGGDQWQNHLGAQIPYVAGQEEAHRGSHLALFRMRATNATSVCRVAAFLAWSNTNIVGATHDTFGDVWVTSDEYRLYEMGVIQIPPEGYRRARNMQEEEFYNLTIGVAAERVSGTGNLRVDYVTLIPQQHFISLKNIQQDGSQTMTVITTEDEDVIGWSTKFVPTPWETYLHEVNTNNWFWPADPSKYLISVIAADLRDGDGHHPINKSAAFGVDVLPRYWSYNAD